MKGVLVTGGTGGIGSALVRSLRGVGRDVFFTFKSQEGKAQELAKTTGAQGMFYDALDRTSLRTLCEWVRQQPLEGLVNLAAGPMQRQSIFKLDPNALLDEINADLVGPISLSQAFAQACRDQKRPGAIVNVLSSVVMGMPPERLLGYVVLKHALLGVTRSMAVELAAHQIRVNAVSPSMTRTNYLSGFPERLIEMLEEDLPFKRLATPEEVAGAIAFLLSPEASYIHGANLPITGGASIC